MSKEKLFKKTDLIIVFILVLIAVAGFFAFRFLDRGKGKTVRVSIDGELFGEYGLYDTENGEEQIIEIPGKRGTCILTIKDGKADMTYAECPNQICVNHAAISKAGETIVCLPNRVVAEIGGAEDEE